MHVLQIHKTRIRVQEREQLTSWSQNAFEVAIEFSTEWEDLNRRAVFTNGDVTKTVLIQDNKAVIPWEVLVTPGRIVSLHVIGADTRGKYVLTTVETELGTGCVKRGGKDGDNVVEPSPDVVAQIQKLAEEAKDNAEKAERSAAKVADYDKVVTQAAKWATSDVESAGAAQEESIRKTGDGQVKAVADKGQEVLSSIPADYQTLTKAIGINLDHYRGDYDAGTTYNKDDLVFSGGATYWHKGSSPTKGVSTADTSVWTVVSTPSQLQEEVSRVAGEVETAKAGISQLSGEIAAYGLTVVDGALCVKFEEG